MSILKSALKIISGKGKREPAGCRVCGTCCELFGHAVRASAMDRERWEEEGRADILVWLSEDGVMTVNRVTGRDASPCPFLERSASDRAICSINDTKPAFCRNYPTAVHGGRCVLGVEFQEGKP